MDRRDGYMVEQAHGGIYVDMMWWPVFMMGRVKRVRRDVFTKTRYRLAFGLHQVSFGHDRVSFGLDQLSFERDNTACNRFSGLQHRRENRLFYAPKVERLCVESLKCKIHEIRIVIDPTIIDSG